MIDHTTWCRISLGYFRVRYLPFNVIAADSDEQALHIATSLL